MSLHAGELYEPWAAKAQGVHDTDDDILTARGRRLHPTCAFWWGRRIDGPKAYAVCYVCGATMTTFAGKWPMTAGAVKTVLRHRREHLAKLAASILATG